MARFLRDCTGYLAATLVAVAMSGPAAAQDCPRGTLDKAYCDRNGDLVADTPTDPKQIVNPSTIIFSYTPVEDPAVYAKVWDGFIKHMEKTTGKRVVFFPVQSNAAQLEAMRSGRLHVAGINTGGNPIAVNCAGFVPFTMMASKDGSYGYEMGDHRSGRQPDQDAGRPQGQEGGVHVADL
jgi:phosphonate transport system substrate-binding protein